MNEPQPLSEIELRQYILPPTYVATYERLLRTNPTKAQAFWDKWKIAVKTDVELATERAARQDQLATQRVMRTLENVRQSQRLKRRV